MITPVIKLVAYEDANPAYVFVAVPDARGRYMRTDRCVVEVPCARCEVAVGEPCRGSQGYCVNTHWVRRKDASDKRRTERKASKAADLEIDAHAVEDALMSHLSTGST